LAILAQKHGDIALAKNSISSALYLEPNNKGIQFVAHQLGVETNQVNTSLNAGEPNRQTT
jgi:hypothetical protein